MNDETIYVLSNWEAVLEELTNTKQQEYKTDIERLMNRSISNLQRLQNGGE